MSSVCCWNTPLRLACWRSRSLRPRARQDLGDVWGTDDLPFFSRYDGLMYFRITPLGEYCLGIASSYESAPIEVRPVLRVLPNLEIAAIGPDLERGDRRALDAYATQMAEYVWRLGADKLQRWRATFMVSGSSQE